MEVALMANTGFLTEEPRSFRDLVVGLIDEQVRVTQVMPERGTEAYASGFGRVAGWRESSWSPLDRRRIARMVEAYEDPQPDVIHALDSGLWPPAVSWAERLGAAVMLSVWAIDDVALARRLARRLDPGRCVFAAATEPLRRETALHVDAAFRVEHVPPGVHLGEPPPPAEPGRSPSVVVSGDGKLDAYVTRLFAGLRLMIDELPETQVVVDTRGDDQRALWRHAEERGLLGNLSFVPPRPGHREMLLRADVFVQPQPLGRARSLALQAMAAARPILAQRDPAIDYLHEGKTAALVDLPDGDTWARRLLDWARSASRRDALGQSARAWVAEHRVASASVDRTIDLYRALTAEAMPFPGAAAGA